MAQFASIKESVIDLPRKLNEEEVIRAIRVLIAAEMEAVLQYELLIKSTDNDTIKKIVEDIRSDELKHRGNLEFALQLISEDDRRGIIEGAKEAQEIIEGAGQN